MKKFTALLATSLLLASSMSYAFEPTNLNAAKKTVIQYHDSGKYLSDINSVIVKARAQLKTELSQHANNKHRDAIVLDIDETSLSNYESMTRLNFGGTFEEITQDEDKGLDPAITPTLELYKFAKANGVAVFFITGRKEFERADTIKNLTDAGYSNWDGLILRSPAYLKASAKDYKTAMRKQLTDQGYHIVMNIGDQESDLIGGYAEYTYKLPNPYYFIP